MTQNNGSDRFLGLLNVSIEYNHAEIKLIDREAICALHFPTLGNGRGPYHWAGTSRTRNDSFY